MTVCIHALCRLWLPVCLVDERVYADMYVVPFWSIGREAWVERKNNSETHACCKK